MLTAAVGVGLGVVLASDTAGSVPKTPLPPGNGRDDTAAINEVLARSVGQSVYGVGDYLISSPIVVGAGTTLDMTSCTVTLVPGSNCNLLRNAAAGTDARDRGIVVTGGLWQRGANQGAGSNTHSLFFRRVDDLTVTNLRVTSSAGKYALAIGDAMGVRVRALDFDTSSDGVHISGPAADISVHGLTGRTGDDMMALTARDYAHYADTFGDIVGVVVDGVYPAGSLAAFKLISGAGTVVCDVSVRRVSGTTTIRPVAIIDDLTGPTSVSQITLTDLDVQSSNPADSLIWLRCTGALEGIAIRNVRIRGPVTARQVVLIDKAADIRSLALDGILLDAATSADLVRVTDDVRIRELRVRRVRTPGGFSGNGVSVESTATVQDVEVENYRVRRVRG